MKSEIPNTPPDMSKIPAGWVVPEELSPKYVGYCSPTREIISENVSLIHQMIDHSLVDEINKMMESAPSVAPVSVQGMQDIKTPEDIGSFRTTMWNKGLADLLFGQFEDKMPKIKICTDFTPTDWWQTGEGSVADIWNAILDPKEALFKHRVWELVGVSPLLRYMKYRKGGKHACHYDAGYLYPNSDYRTLDSFVLYLSHNDEKSGGATRIINDGQQNTPIWDRDHADWSREVLPEEVLFKSYPKKGNCLVFEHRVPHDVEEFKGKNPQRHEFFDEHNQEERIIIRGDLIYKAIR
jgi:hypothetical protein